MATKKKSQSSSAKKLRERRPKTDANQQEAAAADSADTLRPKGGILEVLRRWPIADLNLKRARVKPRKIDI